MYNNHMVGVINRTPIKFFFEIIFTKPSKFWQIITGLKIFLLPDSKVYDLIKKGYSFARWGDGETAICRGKFAWYQEYSSELEKKLVKLLKHTPTEVILGFPWAVYTGPNDKRWNMRIFKIIFSTRVFVIKNLNNKKLINRQYSTLDFWWRKSNDLSALLKRLLDGKYCILISSNREYLKFCPENTFFISAPEINAFAGYEEIRIEIDAYIKRFERFPVILSAIGPASKALVLDYSGICQVLDIGHGFSFALNGPNAWAWTNT
jgi:hypothetical protein